MTATRYNRRVRPRQVGLRFARHALVSFYVLAFVAMPFAHHDLACHLKSSTHCATCHIGTSADPGGADPAIATIALTEAGRADEPSYVVHVSPASRPSAGRSPPSATL